MMKGTLNLLGRLTAASLSPRVTNTPEQGVVRSRDPLNFFGPQSYLLNGQNYSRQVLYTGRIYQVLALGCQTTP